MGDYQYFTAGVILLFDSIPAALCDGESRGEEWEYFESDCVFGDSESAVFAGSSKKRKGCIQPLHGDCLMWYQKEGGLKIGDQFFPAGTILSVNSWVYHRSKEYFGDDADEFKPERCLQPSSGELEKYYIPFGAGYNSCVGRNLAMIELHKISATVLKEFEIRQVDPKKS